MRAAGNGDGGVDLSTISPGKTAKVAMWKGAMSQNAVAPARNLFCADHM